MSASQIAHNDGFDHIGGILNGSQSKTTNVYLGLRNCDGVSGRPADAAAADTLTSNLSEVSTSGTGYGRIAVAWTALTKTAVGNTIVLTLPAETFSFTGSCSATHSFLCTTSDNSGKLIGSAPLQAPRNFANGDSDAVTFKYVFEQGT